jgi:septation ring formation regulator EzrA
MEIQSAFNTGVQGFQKATEDAERAAASIASNIANSPEDFGVVQENKVEVTEQKQTGGEPRDLNQSIVDLRVAEFQAKASAEVVESADESLGTLLDVRV